MPPLETTVRSDADLWRWIRGGGGICADEHRDSGLSGRENRRAYAYLDRRDGARLDELAAEIGDGMPWFGIKDGEGLFAWLSEYRAQREQADVLAEYQQHMYVVCDPIGEEADEWEAQARRMAQAMLKEKKERANNV